MLELSNPESCLNRAADDEPLFVLRANDETAPQLVRDWAERYLAAKCRQPGGPTLAHVVKFQEARRIADDMEHWRAHRPLGYAAVHEAMRADMERGPVKR